MNKVLFLISIIFFNCSCINNKKYQKDKFNFINYTRYIIPRTSFFQIKNVLTFKICDNKNVCNTSIVKMIGSGVLIKKNKNIFFVLTAKHVCELYFTNIKFELLDYNISIYDINKKRYNNIKIVATNNEDMCILKSSQKTKYNPVLISKEKPYPGDKVYNVAAPLNLFKKNLIPIFEGIYLGEEKDNSWYNLYSNNGSSGSMIVNQYGRLIGIITHSHLKIPISRSPLYRDLIKFLDNNKILDN